MASEMTRLPPLESLRIFAVAARHLSFTKAAGELNLTQSAVSHRVKALEEELGVILFNRLVRRLELTGAGAALAHTMRQAIHHIERGVAELDRTGGALRLSITMLPSVASRWFVPRLTRFRKRRPDIEVQVIAEPRLLDLRAEGIDLAIRFGRGLYPGYAVTELMPDWVFPVCSPEFLASRRVETIDQLIELPLLHDSATEGDGSASDWRSWLDHLGRPDVRSPSGQRFSEATLLIDATASGLGVALARAKSRHRPHDDRDTGLPVAFGDADCIRILHLGAARSLAPAEDRPLPRMVAGRGGGDRGGGDAIRLRA